MMLQNFHTYFCAIKLNYNILEQTDQTEYIAKYVHEDQDLQQDEDMNNYKSNHSSDELEFENVEYLLDSDYSNKFKIEEIVLVPDNQSEIFDLGTNETIISSLDVNKKLKHKDPIGDQIIKEYADMNCDLCSIELESFSQAKRHYMSKHDVIGYLICCKRKYLKRKMLLNHVKNHLSPNKFKCKQCDKVLKCSRSLNSHFMNCHSFKKPFQCDYCGICFSKKNQLTSHIKIHALSMYEYPCQYCSKTFNTPYRLTAHNLIHEPSKFVCKICSKELQSKFSLAFHVRTVHTIVKNEDRIKCEKCSHFLKNLESYKKHMRRHKESEQDNICPYCNKNSPNVDALRKHIKFVHESIKNLKCHFCDKRFVRPQERFEHEATHTGEALYICSFCPKTL